MEVESQARVAIPAIDPSTEALIRFRRDAWSFLSSGAVITLDQADRWNPIKPYPGNDPNGPGPYLRWITQRIVAETLLAIVKHRRMLITWTACAIYLWDAMFHEGRFNALISKKEEDADDLVRRCKHIYDHIPRDILRFKPDMTYKYTELRFPEINSVIKGVAQGPDQLRQYTCSRILADEIAFWPHARATFVAMKPTIEGGGKVCLVSTRFPGFFKDLIEDTLDYAA